jgi:membrane-associated phospholipid phosphatase
LRLDLALNRFKRWTTAACSSALLLAVCVRAAAAQTHVSLAVPQSAVEFSQPLETPDEAPRLVWNPKWPRFRAIGYVLTAASVAGALAATFLLPYPDDPRWVGGIFADTKVRKLLRARTPSLRDGVRTASDITLIASLVQTGLIDGFLLPIADDSWFVAWQLTLMNAQAFALNILVATVLFKTAARGRPAYADCAVDRNSDPLCAAGTFASFPSSHTSTTFTAAGLTCIHHKYLPLYGGQPWDAAACASSLVIASATGLFRVVGDRHWLSDVVLGAAFGFSLGYFYPYLFHYQYGEASPPHPSRASLVWGFVPGAQQTPYGLSVMGLF